MNVVTGATGHIGNVLVRWLLEKGEKVRAVIPPFEDDGALQGLPVEVVRADVRDLPSLVNAFRGAERVFHLAALISVSPGAEHLLHQVNVVGTRHVVQACLDAAVRRLVFTSSIEALVPPAGGGPIDETIPFEPAGLCVNYGRSKALATLEVLDGIRRGLDAVIICPTGVVGPFDFRRALRTSPMGQLVEDVSRGRWTAYIEGAFDFVDVRDVAAGLISAGEHGRRGEVYILSGHMIRIETLIAMAQEAAGVKAPRIRLPLWLARVAASFAPCLSRVTKKMPRITHDTLHIITQGRPVCHAKATRELGYSPRPFDVTIADTLRWLKEARA